MGDPTGHIAPFINSISNGKNGDFNSAQLDYWSYQDINSVILSFNHLWNIGNHDAGIASDFFYKKGLNFRLKVLLDNVTNSFDVWKSVSTSGRRYVLDIVNTRLGKVFSPSVSNMIGVLVLGKEGKVGYRYNHLYKLTGTLHLFVISGFHLSFWANLLRERLDKIFPKWLSLLLSLVWIYLYCYLVGFSPGLFRAFFMFVISTIITFFSRQKRALYVLILTLFIALIIDVSIISDIGFQLSFTSVLAILLWNSQNDENLLSSFKMKYRKQKLINKIIDYVLSSASLSLSVLFIILPLLIYYFGEISLVGLVTCILVGWSIPIILKYFLYLFPLFLVLNTYLLRILFLPLELLVEFIIQLLKIFENYWYIGEITNISINHLVLYYCIYLLIYSIKIAILHIKFKKSYENRFDFF